MPHIIIKKVWDYCSYNKKFLLFILVLLFISSLIQNYVRMQGDYYDWILLKIIVFIIVSGYGLSITQSRINHGKELPKINVKDIILLGIKSSIVTAIYLFVQGFILSFVCSTLGFPLFDLEELLFNWSDTIHMFFQHEPVNTILFIVFGSILFYITTFFMEIAFILSSL